MGIGKCYIQGCYKYLQQINEYTQLLDDFDIKEKNESFHVVFQILKMKKEELKLVKISQPRQTGIENVKMNLDDNVRTTAQSIQI